MDIVVQNKVAENRAAYGSTASVPRSCGVRGLPRLLH